MRHRFDQLGAREVVALYLWAASCAMRCSYTDMEDSYATMFIDKEEYHAVLSGLVGDPPTCFDDSGRPRYAEVVKGLRHRFRETFRPDSEALTELGRELLSFLELSGNLEAFGSMAVTGDDVVVGVALPYGSLETCFASYMAAAKNRRITLEESHNAVRELVEARILVKCSAAGYDRYFSP